MTRGLSTALLVMSFILGMSGCRSVSLEERGIGDLDSEKQKCLTTTLPVYINEKYNREVGANDYLLYVVASLAAYYTDGQVKGFRLENYSPEWGKIGHVETPNGLGLDYYYKDGPDVLTVLVAFRGTDLLDPRDWFANLS